MTKDKKSTKHFKSKHLATTVIGSKAVKKFRDKDLKKDNKLKKNETKRAKASEEEIALSREVAALLASMKTKKVSTLKSSKNVNSEEYLQSALVDDDDSEELDLGESDDDEPEVLMFGDDNNAEAFEMDDEDEDDDDEAEQGMFDEDMEVDEDEFDEDDLMDDEDAEDEDVADEFDDEDVADDDMAGGVFETIDDEYLVDSDAEEEEGQLTEKELVAKHKKELLDLKKKDPELYKHLQRNAKGLLEFNDEEEEAEEAQKDDSQRLFIETLTKEKYLALRKPFDNSSFSSKHVALLVKYLKSAAIVRQIAQKGVKGGKKAIKLTQNRATEIVSTKLFNHFLQFALRTLPGSLMVMLMKTSGLKEKIPKGSLKTISITLSEGECVWSGSSVKSLSGWTKVAPLARAYFLAISALLTDEIDSMILRFVMRTMLPAIPMIEDVGPSAPKLLKALLRVWSLGADIATLHKDENGASKFGIDHASRIDAFLGIRRMCLVLPPNSLVLEATLKGIYLSYVRVAKHVHAHTMPTIIFLTNCVSEIYGIDPTASYQHAFVYIRQMAIHLRSAVLKPNEKSIRSVYNWQFVNCLRIWCSVLSAHAKTSSSPLYALIYPVVQICLGVIEVSAAAAYFPVRFQILEFLNQLARETTTYVPISPYILYILKSSILNTEDGTKKGKGKGKNSNSIKKRANDIKYKLHVSSGILDSDLYKEMVITNIIDIMTSHLSMLSHSIAFPELALPVKYLLKKYTRENSQNNNTTKSMKQLLNAINDNIQYITQLRLTCQFSPKDLLTQGISGVDTFTNASVLKELNDKVMNSKGTNTLTHFNTAAMKTNKTKVSPLEKFYEIRLKNMAMLNREEVVLSAQKRNEELDGNNDDEDDEEEGATAIASDDEEDADMDDEDLDDNLLDDEDEEQDEEEASANSATLEEMEMEDEVGDFVMSDEDDEPVAKKAKKNVKPANKKDGKPAKNFNKKK